MQKLQDGSDNNKEKIEERKKGKRILDAERQEKEAEEAKEESNRKQALLDKLEAAGGKLSQKYQRLFDIDAVGHDSAALGEFALEDDEDEDRNEMQPKPKGNHPLELLLAGLPMCFSRGAVDTIAEKFCYLNTKSNRARIVQVT